MNFRQAENNESGRSRERPFDLLSKTIDVTCLTCLYQNIYSSIYANYCYVQD